MWVNLEIIEFDELGENESDFGTRLARDAEEGAELAGRFADLGVASAGDFLHRFRHSGHASPTKRPHLNLIRYLLLAAAPTLPSNL